jgi:hypothetical protein
MSNLDTTFLIALGAAVLSAASMVLHVVAPRTKNTIDDEFAKDIDEVLAFVRGQIPARAAVAAPPDKSPVAPVAMLLVMLLGVAAATTLPACATVRPVASSGVSAFLDCEAQHFDAQLMTDATTLAKAIVVKWVSGTGTADTASIKSDLAPFKSDLGKCAIAAAIAVLTSPPPAPPPGTTVSALMAFGPGPTGPTITDGLALRVAFSAARADLGWRPVVLSSGAVL